MENDKHLVSVITACYNAEAFLARTIASVLEQTYEGWELILVNDCSTDSTAAIIKEFTDLDKRIKSYELKSNAGAAVARNTAIKHANGRFIAFLDSDDLWHPKKLELQLQFMLLHNHAFTHSAYQIIDLQGHPLPQIIRSKKKLSFNDMLYANHIGCLTAIYDTKKLGKIYMPLLRKRQDYALWLTILKTEKNVYAHPEVLAYYRPMAGSLSKGKIDLLRWNWKVLYETAGLSWSQSVYYLIWHVINRIKKGYSA